MKEPTLGESSCGEGLSSSAFFTGGERPAKPHKHRNAQFKSEVNAEQSHLSFLYIAHLYKMRTLNPLSLFIVSLTLLPPSMSSVQFLELLAGEEGEW